MRLPPFTTLTALEAAARHRSYSRAADELFVTHGAVSQQIRKLEDELGVRLFLRQGNRMEPTATGAALAASVTEALATLRHGVEAARNAACGPIVLSTGAAFATRWLVTRLARLSAETGEPDLTVRVEDRVSDLSTDGVDVALRFGVGPWPGVESVRLLSERLFPVCSPASWPATPSTARRTCCRCRCCATPPCPGVPGSRPWACPRRTCRPASALTTLR